MLSILSSNGLKNKNILPKQPLQCFILSFYSFGLKKIFDNCSIPTIFYKKKLLCTVLPLIIFYIFMKLKKKFQLLSITVKYDILTFVPLLKTCLQRILIFLSVKRLKYKQGKSIFIKLSNYQDQLLSTLQELYQDQQLCDVSLYTDEGIHGYVISAHGNVLAATCQNLRPMLMNSKRFKTEAWMHVCMTGLGIPAAAMCTKPILLKGLQPAALKSSVDYVYGIETEISMDNAEQLLEVSVLCGMASLSEVCEDFLQQHIAMGASLRVFAIASKLKLESLHKAALRYILKNFKDCCFRYEKDSFVELPVEMLLQIMLSDSVERRKCLEAVMFEAAVMWLERSHERLELVTSVFQCLQFERMSPKYLSEIVEANHFIQGWKEQRLLSEAYRKIALGITS